MVTLLWDLDGTLVDSMPVIARCLNKTVNEYQLPAWSDEALRPMIGPELGEILATMLNLESTEQIREAKEVYRRHYRGDMLTSPVFAGVESALNHFQATGNTQLVATAKYQLYAEQIVTAQGVRAPFAAVYGSEEDGRLGNKTDLLAHIIEEEALKPSQCIMIGDTQYDMMAGRNHNMTTVGVLWGYGGEEALKEAGAHFLVETPADLIDVIKQATYCGC